MKALPKKTTELDQYKTAVDYTLRYIFAIVSTYEESQLDRAAISARVFEHLGIVLEAFTNVEVSKKNEMLNCIEELVLTYENSKGKTSIPVRMVVEGTPKNKYNVLQ